MMARAKISTGSRAFDALLGGGAQPGSFLLLYGEPASGKTVVCLNFVANHLTLDPAAKAVYIDSDAKFSLERLKQITEDRVDLRRFFYSKPTTFQEQANVIDDLESRLEPSDLVVIDSITGLYRVETGDSKRTFMENKELNRQLGQLKEIALTKEAATIITGQVRSILDSPIPAVEPVAPRLLYYWADFVVKLENTANSRIKQITLEKPTSRKGTIRLAITPTGLEDEKRW